MAAGHTVTATASGTFPFNSKHRSFYRDNIEFPFFLYHLKGKGRTEIAGSLYVRDRAATNGTNTTEWPPKGSDRQKRFI